MPVYNEKQWIEEIVSRVLKQQISGIHRKELVIVDDCSDDGTSAVIQELSQKFSDEIVVVLHEKNFGKGAAVRTAIEKMTGDVTIIQDADLEYHPDEYPQLIEPILKKRADVVFGSRFIGAHRCFLFTHYFGNRIVNLIASILYDTHLSDFMTCYKAFRTQVLKGITISSNRFGVEAEITGEVFRRGLRVYEVPISYSGRDYSEGKKIKWTDFFIVVWWLFKTKLKKLRRSG